METNIPKNITKDVENKLDEFDNKLNALYDDFKKQYINWKTNIDVENSEPKNIFENTKNNIIFEKNKLTKINMEILKENDNINKKIILLKNHLEHDKQKFLSLKEEKSEQNVQYSKILYDDTYTQYFNNFVYNILLFIGLILFIILAIKLGQIQFINPTFNFTLGFFVIYLIIILVYIYLYNVKTNLFLILIIPFFIFSISLFVKKT